MFPLFFIYLFFFMYFLTFLIFLTVHTGGQILNERDPIQITTIIIIIYTIDELFGFKCLTNDQITLAHTFGHFCQTETILNLAWFFSVMEFRFFRKIRRQDYLYGGTPS